MIELTQPIVFQPELAAQEKAAAREDRFAALVERQSRFIFRVAYSILRNTHDAEDAVQETFLRLYRTGAWEAAQNERAYLARTAWRIAVDKLRNRRDEPLHLEWPSDGESPEGAALTADWHAAIHRLVGALPEELRQPLALSTVEELSSQEIAQVMGIPQGTVRTRIMRARQILRQKMASLMEGRYEKR
jgi:RNA polymerase sigma-70 factor (ECF subfamily)